MDGYYRLLEVDRDATVKEITNAYRRLSLKAHPDRKGGSEEAFKALNRAYEVLKDEKKRQSYDRFGLDVMPEGQGAEELASDMMTHVNRALGIAVVRTALAGFAVAAMRRRWPRALAIAFCGAVAVYGRLTRDVGTERVGFRLVAAPLFAWLCSAIRIGALFEVVTYAAACGLAEVDGPRLKAGVVFAAAVVRWLFGARLLFFVKLIGFELALIPVSFLFFQLAGHVANELLKHTLDKLAPQVRAELAKAQAERDALQKQLSNQSGPVRRANAGKMK